MSFKHPRLTGARWCALSLPIFSAFLAAGCLVDLNQRCGENQHYDAENVNCACDSGFALQGTTCAPCAENEVGSPDGCVCADGYVRPAPEDACQPKTDALGMACDTQSAPCADATYSHCQTTAGTSGYCTSTGCGGAADCADGYACDKTTSVPYCRRPPVGAGQSCAAAADCAGTEATFCDTMVTHQCRVQGCTLSPDDCFSGTECCDLSGFGLPQPICVQAGTCPT